MRRLTERTPWPNCFMSGGGRIGRPAATTSPRIAGTWTDHHQQGCSTAMVASTNEHVDANQLVELAERQSWRLMLVGDPLQLQAVGRGGMFAELCACARVETLEQLHRFTNRWEAAASLRLRSGDPCALDSYEYHERIIPGTLGFVDDDGRSGRPRVRRSTRSPRANCSRRRPTRSCSPR
ncbi:MAG: AAA family ATPase [Ilumatobacteraceae bacterium]